MNPGLVGILIASLMVNSAVGIDPTLVLKYKEYTVNTVDNPYFNELTSEISSAGDTASVKIPIKKPWPETTKITANVEFDGMELAEFEDYLCELMKNELYGKDMLKYGLPVGKFPKACPVTPGDYEISKYELPKDKLPPGVPSGTYVVRMAVGESGKDPWVTTVSVIEISHKIPAFGR